jgi:hypothetical protein
MGGAYQKGKQPFVGFGISGSVKKDRLRLDVMLDQIHPQFERAELDHAEAGLTVGCDSFAATPFVYRSQYYGGVPLAAGIAFHLPKTDLHAAPHWIEGSNAIPLPVFWTPTFLDGRLSLMLKAIPIADHFLLGKPAPFIGAEIQVSVGIGKGINIYGKAFEMTARREDGSFFIGALNAQGGFEWRMR